MKTVPSIRHCEFGVAPIDCVPSKARVIAKILSAGTAICAGTIRPTKPRDPHTISDCEGGSAATVGHFTNFFDLSDNLVTKDQRQFRIEQFAIDHVKISAANRASADSHKQLTHTRLWLWHIAQLQRFLRFVENH